MAILKALLFIVAAVVALTIFGKVRQKVAANAPAKSSPAANAKDPGLSPHGFFLMSREYENEKRVIIMTPPNCPSDEAVRAQALASTLSSAGVPTETRQEIDGTFNSPDDMARFQKYMNNVTMPLVVVRGWAKGNPLPEDVIAQYNSGK